MALNHDGMSARSLERLGQQCQRFPTMTHQILLRRRKFRAGLPRCNIQKQRIVPKPAGASRCEQNLALPQALRDHRFGVPGMAHYHDDAVIMRLAVSLNTQYFEQFLVVAFIRPWIPRKPRGVYSRCATQRIDAKTGIVRKHWQPGKGCNVSRLGNGILDESVIRLFCVRYAERGLRYRFNIDSRKDLAYFPKLTRVAGRDDQSIEHLARANVALNRPSKRLFAPPPVVRCPAEPGRAFHRVAG